MKKRLEKAIDEIYEKLDEIRNFTNDGIYDKVDEICSNIENELNELKEL